MIEDVKKKGSRNIYFFGLKGGEFGIGLRDFGCVVVIRCVEGIMI